MSDIILDPKIYEALANKMLAAGHRGSIGINHLPSCRTLTEEKIASTVRIWNRLNVDTYNLKRAPSFKMNIPALTILFHQMPVSTYQFLKWLNCLQDNISVKGLNNERSLTEEEYEAMQFLSGVVIDTMKQIIFSLPKYEDAKYCNF